MAPILVAGLINIETTLEVEGFPIPYFPVRHPFHGVNSTVSGVGYHIAKALITLGHEVAFLSIIGEDMAAQQVRAALVAENLPGENVLRRMAQTVQSVIHHPELRKSYLLEIFGCEMARGELLAFCNINFSRPPYQPPAFPI